MDTLNQMLDELEDRVYVLVEPGSETKESRVSEKMTLVEARAAWNKSEYMHSYIAHYCDIFKDLFELEHSPRLVYLPPNVNVNIRANVDLRRTIYKIPK